MVPTWKKGWPEHLGSYRAVGLTLDPWKVMRQIILSAVTQHTLHNCQSSSLSKAL